MSKSYKNQSISDISLSLARRQVALRHGFEESTVKQADVGEYLSGGLKNLQEGAKTWWNNRDPVAQKAMIGAGLGGVAGASSSLLRKNRRKHFLRDAFTGALGGGALFGGIGAVQDYKRLADNIVDVKTPAGEQAKNRPEDQKITDRARKYDENNEDDPVDTSIKEISNLAGKLLGKFDPIRYGQTAIEQMPGGEYVPAAGVGYGLTAAGAKLNDLVGNARGIQNLTKSQFDQLGEVLKSQMGTGPLAGKPERTPMGITLRNLTGSDEAVTKILSRDYDLMRSGVKVKPPGLGPRGGKPKTILTSYEKMLENIAKEKGLIPEDTRKGLATWTQSAPKAPEAKVPQGALEQLVQKSVDKPLFERAPGARALSGVSKGLSKVPRPRIPKTKLGVLTWLASLAAAALSHKNRQKSLAAKSESQQLINPQSAP
jgi:hypothetical protein